VGVQKHPKGAPWLSINTIVQVDESACLLLWLLTSDVGFAVLHPSSLLPVAAPQLLTVDLVMMLPPVEALPRVRGRMELEVGLAGKVAVLAKSASHFMYMPAGMTITIFIVIATTTTTTTTTTLYVYYNEPIVGAGVHV
jgi:hypothetical protein